MTAAPRPDAFDPADRSAPPAPPPAPAVEWPTVALIVATYGGWAAAGWWLWPVAPVLALAVMAVAAAQHASLVHECLHGHPTRRRWLNEALVGANLSVVWPYRRFRTTHLKHHDDERLTDPFEDPESWYRALWDHARLPRAVQGLLRVNNTMPGRVVLGPWIGTLPFLWAEARALRAGDRGVRRAWALHLVGLVPVAGAVWTFGIPAWAYLLGVVWPSMSLIAIRTFAEHRWHDAPEGRTIIVERSPLGLLFLYNNLHIVHHTFPTAPWYRLPELYRAHRGYWARLNQGYVYASYWEMFRRHGLSPKEPVVHPALRRDP